MKQYWQKRSGKGQNMIRIRSGKGRNMILIKVQLNREKILPIADRIEHKLIAYWFYEEHDKSGEVMTRTWVERDWIVTRAEMLTE